jgi:hypothetical protein
MGRISSKKLKYCKTKPKISKNEKSNSTHTINFNLMGPSKYGCLVREKTQSRQKITITRPRTNMSQVTVSKLDLEKIMFNDEK